MRTVHPDGLRQDAGLGQFIFYAAPAFYEQARRLSGGQVEEIWDRVLDQAKETGDKVKDEVEGAVREAAT